MSTPAAGSWPQRAHWVCALVGWLRTALGLTPEEELVCLAVVADLLEQLRVGDRPPAGAVPAVVAAEAELGQGAGSLARPDAPRLSRYRARLTGGSPVETFPVEAWRDALVGMIVSSYPDLAGAPAVWAAGVLDELLVALGLPDREVWVVPDEVVRAHRNTR